MAMSTPLLGLGALGAAACGLLPRAGPLRALVLAVRSKFRTAQPASERCDAVNILVRALKTCKKDQYIVVTGPTGIGKTCVVKTATQRTMGVVHVEVASGKPVDEIVRDVCAAISNTRVGFVDPFPSTRRILWFYRCLFPRPIIVLQADGSEAEAYTGMTGAVRRLTQFGLRVVVDSSTNSLPIELVSTKRQMVIDLGPMTKQTMLSIPEISDLFGKLRAVKLEHVVWEVLGGIPASHRMLHTELDGVEDPGEVTAVVSKFIKQELLLAMRLRHNLVLAQPQLLEIIQKFKGKAEIPLEELKTWNLDFLDRNKVLRVVSRQRKCMLIPADPAMAVVLRHDLDEAPSIEQLELMMMMPPKLQN